MKNLMALCSLMFLSFNLFSNDTIRNITCDYNEEGFDYYYINANILEDGSIKDVVYTSSLGDYVIFPNNASIFEYTNDILIIKYAVTFSTDLKTAKMKITYKSDESILSENTFICN